MGANYQRLGIPNLEALVGAGVFYGGGITEAQAMVGQHVFVAGGGNSAGQAAVHLAKYAEQVTMMVRGSSLAASMSDYLIQAIASAENIEVRTRTQIVDGYGRQHLESLVLREVGAEPTETVAAAARGCRQRRGRLCCSKPACPGSLPPATSATARSSAAAAVGEGGVAIQPVHQYLGLLK